MFIVVPIRKGTNTHPGNCEISAFNALQITLAVFPCDFCLLLTFNHSILFQICSMSFVQFFFRIQLENVSPEIGVDPPIRTVAAEDLLTKITSVPQRQTQMHDFRPRPQIQQMGFRPRLYIFGLPYNAGIMCRYFLWKEQI